MHTRNTQLPKCGLGSILEDQIPTDKKPAQSNGAPKHQFRRTPALAGLLELTVSAPDILVCVLRVRDELVNHLTLRRQVPDERLLQRRDLQQRHFGSRHLGQRVIVVRQQRRVLGGEELELCRGQLGFD